MSPISSQRMGSGGGIAPLPSPFIGDILLFLLSPGGNQKGTGVVPVRLSPGTIMHHKYPAMLKAYQGT